LPGELAPKLALGHAYTLAGDLDRAILYYDLVSRTDPIVTGAAFGLARCLAQRGDRAGAVAAYERVPGSSNRYPSALLARGQVLLDGAQPGVEELTRAAAAVEALAGTLDGLPLHQLSAHLLCTAAELVEARAAQFGASSQLLGVPVQAFHLRLAAERELRACARFATDPAAKIRFVDEANRVRPLTLV